MADEAPAEAPAAAEEPVVDEATRERLQALDALRGKIREHKEIEAKLKEARLNAKGLIKEFNDTEGALNALDFGSGQERGIRGSARERFYESKEKEKERAAAKEEEAAK